jgi:DNA ligase-1
MIKTLYKKDSKNRIQEWTIEVQENKIRTHEGLVGGKISTNDWKECTGKNIGKSNETSPHEQALAEAESKYKKKLETGYTANVQDVDSVDVGFLPMLAHKFVGFEGTCISQPKLDGIRNIATKDGCFTRNGKPQLSIPHIIGSLKPLFQKYPDLVVDGELYNHKLRDDFNAISSIARKQKPTSEDLEISKNNIQFHVYDVCFKDIPNATLEYRISFIEDIVSKYDFIEVVKTDLVETTEMLDVLYGEYLTEGFEGQMVRKYNSVYENTRSKNLLKRKEFIDDEFEIVDIESGCGNWANKAKTILFRKPDGTLFSTGLKGTMEYATELLENKNEYIGKMGTVRYQNLTPDGIPRFGVLYSIRNYE